MHPVFRDSYGIQSETSHNEELKIMNLGHLHNVQKEHVEE